MILGDTPAACMIVSLEPSDLHEEARSDPSLSSYNNSISWRECSQLLRWMFFTAVSLYSQSQCKCAVTEGPLRVVSLFITLSEPGLRKRWTPHRVKSYKTRYCTSCAPLRRPYITSAISPHHVTEQVRTRNNCVFETRQIPSRLTSVCRWSISCLPVNIASKIS